MQFLVEQSRCSCSLQATRIFHFRYRVSFCHFRPCDAKILFCIIIIGAIAITTGVFGQGLGPVLLHNVMCTGYEHRIFDCHNLGIERSSCGHSRDAGVVCSTGKQH